MQQNGLTKGIELSKGFDHRGPCYQVSDAKLGLLGKIVLIDVAPGQMLFNAEIFEGPNLEERKELLLKVAKILENMIDKRR